MDFSEPSVSLFANLPFPTMSTTSTMTASVAKDQILNNEVDIPNHICILVLTRGDGTPFDVTSIHEENIIEICVWVGYTHPKGVLQYCSSQISHVISFHRWYASDSAWVIKAMTFHEEAIKGRTSPPSATHVRAYMAVMEQEPSGAQCPTPDREGNPQQPPSDCYQVGVPHVNYKPTLRTLWMMSCNSSWGISSRRLLSES